MIIPCWVTQFARLLTFDSKTQPELFKTARYCDHMVPDRWQSTFADRSLLQPVQYDFIGPSKLIYDRPLSVFWTVQFDPSSLRLPKAVACSSTALAHHDIGERCEIDRFDFDDFQ